MTEQTEAPAVHLILAWRWDEFKHEMDKLVRKAQRYGSGEVGYTDLGVIEVDETYTRFDGSRKKITVQYHQVVLTGDAPRVGPYRFLAKVEHHAAGNIVDIIPGEELTSTRYRATKPICEHCNTVRDRHETFVVRNDEDGSELQVGRNCLGDYTGRETPESLAWKFRYLREATGMSEDGGYGRGTPYYSTHEAVGLAIAAVRVWGWMPAWQATDGDWATRSIVSLGLATPFGKEDDDTKARRKKLLNAFQQSDWDEADRIVEWVRAGGLGTGDYGYNVTTIMATDTFEAKRLGYVASVVTAWARHNEQELRRTKERQDAATSEWVGAKKERLHDLDCTLLDQRYLGTGQFGDRILIKFRTHDGNVLTWFTSTGTGLDKGQKLKLTGTVKDHSEYNGAKETQLTRCVVEPI